MSYLAAFSAFARLRPKSKPPRKAACGHSSEICRRGGRAPMRKRRNLSTGEVGSSPVQTGPHTPRREC
jgi:hypothetical protein